MGADVPPQSFHGVSLAWGLGAGVIVVDGVTAALAQKSRVEMEGEAAAAFGPRGRLQGWCNFNPNDLATAEYIFSTSGSYRSGVASIDYPTAGSMIALNADASDPLSGSNWIVQSTTIKQTNIGAARCELRLQRWAGISS